MIDTQVSTDSTDYMVPPIRVNIWRGYRRPVLSVLPAGHSISARDDAEALVDDIAAICKQVDDRLGNRAGIAERGVWFWYYPPDPNVGVEVLTALHRDAVAFLAGIVTGRPTAPCHNIEGEKQCPHRVS